MKARLITQYNQRDDGLDISHYSEQQRANLWIVSGSVGESSKRIWAHMTGTTTSGIDSYPSDPDDLNRCLLLLEAVPEWKQRMPEMASCGPVWAALAARWDEISQSFINEVGLNWCKSTRATATYQLMKQVQATAEAKPHD